MKAKREAGSALIVNHPQASDDGRHAGGKEGMSKTKRAFARRHGAGVAPAGGQHHQTCTGKACSKKIAHGDLARTAFERGEQEAERIESLRSPMAWTAKCTRSAPLRAGSTRAGVASALVRTWAPRSW